MIGKAGMFCGRDLSATLYFNGAVDDAWTTIGNWWLNDGHSVAAGRLPISTDSVVVTSANITASGQTVANFTLSDQLGFLFYLTGTLTVTGTATFNNGTANFGTVTGAAVFNDNSENISTVTGNATFNGTSQNGGTVTGTATFTGSACNDGGTAGTFVPDPPPSC